MLKQKLNNTFRKFFETVRGKLSKNKKEIRLETRYLQVNQGFAIRNLTCQNYMSKNFLKFHTIFS